MFREFNAKLRAGVGYRIKVIYRPRLWFLVLGSYTEARGRFRFVDGLFSVTISGGGNLYRDPSIIPSVFCN